MLLSIDVQFKIIIYAILAGGLTGIIFDLYRIVRGVKVHKFIIVFEDILFAILAAITIFAFLLFMNYAFLGPYVYVLIGVTFFMYLNLISPTVLKVQAKILENIWSVIRILGKRTIYIIKSAYYNICGKINVK